MTQEEIIAKAKELGFDEVHPLDPKTLKPDQMILDTCQTNKCGAFGKNWGCPPHGSLEENAEKLQAFSNGVILQCIGYTEEIIDVEMYKDTEERLNNGLRKLKAVLSENGMNALVLGAGGCKICKPCARPEPCRFPDKRVEALEGYGIFVTQLCRDNNTKYYYGEGSIAFTAVALW